MDETQGKAAADRLDQPVLTAPTQSWSMDFASDALFKGSDASVR